MKDAGFSIIELLVVITILGILAAIAVPNYEFYKVKTEILIAIKAIEPVTKQLTNSFEMNSAWPTSITINGTVLNAGSWSTLNNYQNIYALKYTISSDNLGIYVAFAINNLEWMPGYQEPSSDPLGSFAHYQVIYYALREVNKAIDTQCGSKNTGNTGSIPFSFLPAACTCANVSSYYNGGSC